MQKGVSPLIAAVLLIAFTMAVAAILTAWITTFTEEQTGEVGNRSSQVVECSFADMAIFDAVWDSGGNNVTVSVANTGTVDLTDVNIFVFKDGSRVATTNTGSIASADIVSPTITNVENQPDRIVANSVDCTKLTDEETSVSTQ